MKSKDHTAPGPGKFSNFRTVPHQDQKIEIKGPRQGGPETSIHGKAMTVMMGKWPLSVNMIIL